MNNEKLQVILEEHLRLLQDAAKKQCSGEELKAITEAMAITIDLLENI